MTSSNNTISCSVVVPVYNGSKTLPELIRRLETVLCQAVSSYEVILVNDGSKDHSWEIIKQLSVQYTWITGIDLMRNYGQHNALLCGIRAANYDFIVTMDDDLQHPPEAIPKLLSKFSEGCDVVYGTPSKQQHDLWRNFASTVTKLALYAAIGAKTARQVSAFRAFRKELRQAFEDYRGSYVSIDVLLTWGTVNFTSIQVRHDPRLLGKTNYTFHKLVLHTLNMITGFSTLPLQLASLIGFSFTLFGIGVLAYVIGRYLLLGYSVPGFPFLASIIAIFSGSQLFSLGIIGEYIARIYNRSLGRPPSVIRATTYSNNPSKDQAT